MLILIVSAIGAGGSALGFSLGDHFALLLVSAFVVGGMSNPLYSLLIAHTNDFLKHENMAAASGGLIFINGLGAISGPIITGYMMDVVGPGGFYLFTGVLFLVLVGYAAYRSTQRRSVPVGDTGAYVAVAPSYTAVALESAQEYAIEAEKESVSAATDHEYVAVTKKVNM